MSEAKLNLRQLNRALLARQLLLERHHLAPVEAIERLVALQSQIPNPPYIGLWTRLQEFSRADLTQLLEAREVVRAPWIRSTLHLVSRADHQRFQAVVQPALARGLRSFFGKRAKDLDLDRLIALAKPYIEREEPTIGELRTFLSEHEPERDKEAMGYALRSFLPLVQIPPSGTWGAGTRANYNTAERWLGPPTPADLPALFRRYLRAFGPASVMDFQTWTGMTGLKAQLAPVLQDLASYRGENGDLLYDLPQLSLTDDDADAPLRFLPEYDNILIAHRDRARILPEAYRKIVFASAGRVLSTVLIDGFVAGIWKAHREKSSGVLRVTLFERQSKVALQEIESEGLRLIRFVEDDAGEHRVEISEGD